MSPRIKHNKKGAMTWTRKETSQLIYSIKAQLKKRDPLPYSRRISVLNWQKISIPQKSVKECKLHLDAVIKKIHRTRTLEEMLSAVDVEPIQKIGCGDMTECNIVSSPTDNNRSPAAIHCFKRRSKRLSEANERQDLEDDNLTDDDVSLRKYRYRQEEKVDGIDTGKENHPNQFNNRKRKLLEEEDDDATRHRLDKKNRKLEISPVDCPTGGAVVNESNTNDIDQTCSSSASAGIEVGENVTEVSDSTSDELLGDFAATSPYDRVTETTGIAQLYSNSTTIPNNSNYSVVKMSFVGETIVSEDELRFESTDELNYSWEATSSTITLIDHCETSIKSDDESKIEKVGDTNRVVKKEVIESSPHVFSRIRTICAGFFGRLTGNHWTVKKE